MNTNVVTPWEWFFLLSFVFIAIISFYQAYINLFYRRVSKFSIDALLVFLIIRFGNENARKRARAFTTNAARIILFGVYALLSFFGAVYAITVWLQRISK
jgi:hypothetical protein